MKWTNLEPGWRLVIGPFEVQLEWAKGRRYLTVSFPVQHTVLTGGFRSFLRVGSCPNWFPDTSLFWAGGHLHLYVGLLRFHVWLNFESSANRNRLASDLAQARDSWLRSKAVVGAK
jgi:hypothetical protein